MVIYGYMWLYMGMSEDLGYEGVLGWLYMGIYGV